MRFRPPHRLFAGVLALTTVAAVYAFAQVTVIGDDGVPRTLGAATARAAKCQLHKLKASVLEDPEVVAGARSL